MGPPTTKKNTKKILLVTTFLAFCVVVFGAYVRLSDAGLGCPDWPGCYGYFTVPDSPEELSLAQQAYPQQPVEAPKAWKEMIHRYLASTLGFLIVVLFYLSQRNKFYHRKLGRAYEKTTLPTLLLILVVFQGLLGMWTVTLKVHPFIVLAHLLGGLATLGLLFYSLKQATSDATTVLEKKPVGRLSIVAMTVLLIQIILGGWTSSNYAALGCPDLPFCYGQWWPDNMDFFAGFSQWQPLGNNYEGGLLTPPAKTAIHFTHRLGAIVTLLVLGWFGLKFALGSAKKTKAAACYFIVALIVQFLLGVLMVWSGINIYLAAAHNGFAALLVLSFINLLYAIRTRSR